MSTPKIMRATQHLLRQISRMAQTLTKGLIRWLLRNWLILARRPAQAGFILPTTILLLLVVTLTVGAIGYRTFTRSQQVIGERQQRVIYNAATPAIDRAKSKIEFLFDPDRDRRGGGVPSQTQLLGMMLNDGRDLGNGIRVAPTTPDPYTFPAGNGSSRETRLDINGDGVKDNAWSYEADLDGNGTLNDNDGTVFYSIIFTAPSESILRDNSNAQAIRNRANARPFPFIRNAPLSNATQATNVCQLRAGLQNGQQIAPPINADGWFPDEVNTTKLRKNFQVDAYVVPKSANGSVATLEFQQDREATQGFKWAAWFRNDLEIFPGPAFNWNGAMHTEGSLIVGDSDRFRGFMISDPDSCLYDEEASKLTAADIPLDTANEIPRFQGQFIAGSLKLNNYNGIPKFDLFTAVGQEPALNQPMNSSNDSIMATNGRRPADYALDPVRLQTDGVSVGRNVPDPQVDRATNWTEANPLKKRMVYAKEDTPYVDDTFRADNRYGPYPRFGRLREKLPTNVSIGDPISGKPELTGNDPLPGAESTDVGLDGYWERRARREGLRLIVGQRLELGDLAGWGGPAPNGNVDLANEQLKPWETCPSGTRCNESRQRNSLIDNLSAVQATAIYHAKSPNGVDYPAACLATTIHPGTAGTLDKSATFENLAYGLPTTAFLPPVTPGRESYLAASNRSLIVSDFFRGRGTNGWEYSVPPLTAFTDTSVNNPWMNALRNLAQFAGDPAGGAPSFPPSQRPVGQGDVHPYPLMAMWGDFSMLRQVIRQLDTGTAYDNPISGGSSLSPADKTTLHTAGCLIGMLGYNVDYLEKFNLAALEPGPANPTVDPNLLGYKNITNPSDPNFAVGLRGRLRLILRRNDNTVLGSTSLVGKRLPETIRVTNPTTTPITVLDIPTLDAMALAPTKSNDPETFVRLLERWRDASPLASPAERDLFNKQIYLAQLLISKEQVARDRTFGFKAGEFATTPLGACSTWQGLVSSAANQTANGAVSQDELKRAATEPLSSLCSSRPRFPVLYSLFPAGPANAATPPTTVEAGYTAGGFISHRDVLPNGVGSGKVRDDLDSLDGYIPSPSVNGGSAVVYRVVRPEAVASVPLGISGTTLGSARAWTLPVASAGLSRSTPNSNELTFIKVCINNTPCSQPNDATPITRIPKPGALYRVPFKDSAFFNGRELLSVRALDLDLDLMRTSAVWSDFWLPNSGLIYAYREDGVSEAHIVRPNTSAGTWTVCRNDLKLRTDANCQMKTATLSAQLSTDPPISERKITPKPVDYYADPDRRPHGFRLRNGASLGRTGDEGRGLSFVSHNPAYVMGNFNLHRAPGVTSTARSAGLEEFTERLQDDFGNFYNRNTLDLNFARAANDQWRPSEVLADAVTLLSTAFCDGSVEDGIYSAGLTSGYLPANQASGRYGCVGSGNLTSYLNQNRPNTAVAANKGVRWMRSSIADYYPNSLPFSATVPNPAEGESPIVFRNSNPVLQNEDEYSGSYYLINSGNPGGEKPKIAAPDGIQMNMIMISGLVPSRANQSYGGLHNFPRFLEDWGSRKLYISGAFLQLSFSTYATAPFDQDRFEVSTTPDGDPGVEAIQYYSPPTRLWGYDVGLQYTKAGPVAQRFKFAEAIRSEFYREPASDDPYIANLKRCAATPSPC